MPAIITLYAASIIYAIIRYVAFMPENANAPVYIVNKGWSMAAAMCFAIGFLQQLRKNRDAGNGIGSAHAIGGGEPSLWFRAGLYGAIAHIPMSLAILRPGYFKEFFLDGGAAGRMSFYGEMVFLFGAVTAGGLFLLMRQNWSPRLRWRVSLITMLTLATHVSFMGVCRGLNIDKAHAYLPPMWLLSLICTLMGIMWLLMSKPTDSDAQQSAPWTRDRSAS